MEFLTCDGCEDEYHSYLFVESLSGGQLSCNTPRQRSAQIFLQTYPL